MRHISSKTAAFVTGFLLVTGQTSMTVAQNSLSIDHDKEYRACLDLVAMDAEKALKAATFWQQKGGGVGAAHCRATALAATKKFSEAATIFEEIGRGDAPLPPEDKAEMLAQAGNAYMLEQNPEKAVSLFSEAIKLNPQRAQYFIDRSVASAARGNHNAALQDLNAALEREPNNTKAVVFRASAQRFLGRPQEAFADIEQVLRMQPSNQEALLEQGVLYAVTGDLGQAKASWQHLISVNPESIVAKAARANLQRLDANQ